MMYDYRREERDNIIFDLRGYFHGMAPERGFVQGFGVCNTCQFGDLEGEQEDHPEGLGKVTTGVHINCKENHPLPKGIQLWSTIRSKMICLYYVPNICELCNLLEFKGKMDCKECCWNDDE